MTYQEVGDYRTPATLRKVVEPALGAKRKWLSLGFVSKQNLREQLKEERETNHENRRTIVGLVQRVPELEPARDTPPEPRG